MAGAEEQLTELAARLRSLDAAGVEIATDALAGVQDAARATAAAGTTADGTQWKPTKKGNRPLVGAAAKITAIVSGSSKAAIVLVLRGIEVLHHFGTGRIPARPILPTEKTGVPEAIRDAVRAAAKRVVSRKVKGGSP